MNPIGGMQWPAGSEKLEPEKKKLLLLGGAVVAFIVLLAALSAVLEGHHHDTHRQKVYDECRADGKPNYYCEAIAKEATR